MFAVFPFKSPGPSDPQVQGSQGLRIRLRPQTQLWGEEPTQPNISARLSLWPSLQYLANHKQLRAPYGDLPKAQSRLVSTGVGESEQACLALHPQPG